MQHYFLTDEDIMDRIKQELNIFFDIQNDKYGVINLERIYELFLEHIKILLDDAFFVKAGETFIAKFNKESVKTIKELLNKYIIVISTIKRKININNLLYLIVQNLILENSDICDDEISNILHEFACKDVVTIITSYLC